MNKLAVIILAAGKGERMKSAIPKVLHPVCGRPMLGYVMELVKSLRPQRAVCVLGFKQELVRPHVGAGVEVALQKKLAGTADAVKIALRRLKGFKGTVLVLYGDTPLLKKETVKKLLDYHNLNGVDATLLTGTLKEPAGYGRILRDKLGGVCGIVEEKDADGFQRELKEVNTGIVCFNAGSLRRAITKVRANNRKREYYLTDVISILYRSGRLTDALKLKDISEALGINSRVELSRVNTLMQARLNESYMKAGVSIVDPRSAFIAYGTKIGPETVIYPFAVIDKGVKIGKGCSLGPFIHLREGTVIADGVTAGNFLEMVRTTVGSASLIKHLGYLGDSRIGKGVNIGAGTVVANFDGKHKQNTRIEEGAFIGSDSVLVSPVKVGRRARTGAGSVVTRDVPSGATVVGVPAKPLRKSNG
jgi:bifunctional UDP-N-acetylglucosamine pyrophosphorylase/glucosamine-1-phosphate N-acetyltransferase